MIAFVERFLADFTAEIGRMSLVGPRAGAAFRTMLACLTGILIALVLRLDNPWWAGITGMVLVQKTATATWAKSLDRIIGTFVGAAIGYGLTATIDHHLLFAMACAIVTAFTVYGQGRIEHGYAILLGGITVTLILFGSLETPDLALHLSFYRAFVIVIGVTVAAAVDYAFLVGPRPIEPKRSWPGIFSRDVDFELAAMALSGGVAVALIPFIWNGLQLPGLGQTPITAFVVLVSLRQDPLRRAATRILGCILGGVYGLAMMHLVGDAFLPWLATLGLGLFVSADLNHGDSDVSYVGLQAGIAIVVAMVQGSSASPDILQAIDRLAGIVGGIVLIAICHPLFAPLFRYALEPRPRAIRP